MLIKNIFEKKNLIFYIDTFLFLRKPILLIY